MGRPMHLDVGVADLEAGIQWAVDQGALMRSPAHLKERKRPVLDGSTGL